MKAILVILLCTITSCIRTDIIGLPMETQKDTTIITKKPHKDFSNVIELDDTTKVKIEFNPTVEDWEE